MKNNNMDSKTQSIKAGAITTLLALLVNEIFNFFKLGGLDNPIAACMLKIIIYSGLLTVVYANLLNSNIMKVLYKMENLLTGMSTRGGNYNPYRRAEEPEED